MSRSAPKFRRCYVTALGILILLAGLYIVFIAPAASADRGIVRHGGRLADLLPKGQGEWQSEDLPLGDTEMLKEKVEKILQYDDVLFRSYQNGGKQFSVYVAYWRPGALTSRDVEFHTPDRCWVHAGWKRVAHDTDYRVQVGADRLASAQWRIFKAPNSHTEEVVFWHVVDGKPVNYSHLKGPSDWSILTDILRYGVAMKREQYFIRITSASSMNELSRDGFFGTVLSSLKVLGLAPDV